MGFWSGLGKTIMAPIKGVGHLGIGAGKAGLWGANKLGSKALNEFSKSPGKFIGAIGLAGAAGYIAHDINGENPADGMRDGAIVGTAAAVMGVSSAAVTLGTGTVAAGAMMAKPIIGLAANSVKVPKSFNLLGDSSSKVRLTGVGKGLLAGGLVANSAVDMYNAYEKSRMGQSDGMLRTARPDINTAGATGDLVFAMHKTR